MINLTNLALTTMVISAVYTANDNNPTPVDPREPIANIVNEKSQARLTAATITCDKAMAMLVQKGFTSIVSTDCAGSQYRFEATQKGNNYVVVFAAFSGGMVAIKKGNPTLPKNKISFINPNR